MSDDRAQYSTLEVAHRTADTSQKEVYHGQSDLPQVVTPHPGHEYYKPEDQASQNQYPTTAYSADPGSYYQNSEHGGHSQYYQGVPQYPQEGGYGQASPPLLEKPKGKRICGLAARTFWIIAALVGLGLIAAIVGGAVGGTLSKNNSKDSSAGQDKGKGGGNGNGQNSTTTEPSTVLLGDSRIAAANWTDQGQYVHYAVVTQDKYSNLLGSFWDTQNQTWSSVNISAILTKSGSSIAAKPGTPLALASTGYPGWRFQLNVYYLTPSNSVGEIYTGDLQGRQWGVGALVKEAPKVAAPDSQLAALWHRCPYGCSNQLYILYEDDKNVLNLLNSSDWTPTKPILQGLDQSSGLALVPFIFDGGSNGTNAAEMRLYFNSGNALDELKWNNKKEWESALVLTPATPFRKTGYQITKAISKDPAPQYVATSWDSWQQVMVVSRNANGTVSGQRWDKDKWNTNEVISLAGGPGNATFGYIGMNGEGRFYGLMKGEIHEYRWDFGNPYAFIYVGTVPVPDPKKDS